MFFAGSDTELLDMAQSPPLATWHYFFVVVMTPLIMLNLLIALMGGSYERIEQNTKNAMRRQKAELLVSLEVLMSDEDKRNDRYFPRWLFWYRPAERQAEGTTYENGVINGVKRMLDQQTQEQSKEAIDVRAQVQEQLSQMGEKIEQDFAQRDTKMEQELAQLNANVKQIEKANAMMLQELSSRFEELLGGRRDDD